MSVTKFSLYKLCLHVHTYVYTYVCLFMCMRVCAHVCEHVLVTSKVGFSA